MRGESGQYSITAEELAAFQDSGRNHAWMRSDGSLDFTDAYEPAGAGLIYLGAFSDPWFEQWEGDLQRACDEQLNPILARHFTDTKDVS